MLTAQQIRPVLETDRAMVEQALAWLFPDPDDPVLLDAMEMLAGPGEDLADVLLGHLIDTKTADIFVTLLGARGVELQPVQRANFWDTRKQRPGIDFGDPAEPDFDFEALEDFAPRARAFRCRVLVDNVVKGSGAFVSSRLVLTAAHVIESVVEALKTRDAHDGPGDPPPLPRIDILDANGNLHRARYAWHLPVHPDEFNGALPPATAADTHLDVALLRVSAPLGRSFGRLTLGQPTSPNNGTHRFTLVHYPNGQARGFVPGLFRRNGANDIRIPHDIETEPGSSGGPGFDRDLHFLGLHQGRMIAGGQILGRLVPYECFERHAGFRTVLDEDRPPRYLWSLDGKLDGPIILGRRQFFAGLAAILERPVSLLKGIWVRRRDTSETRGLGFSFEMLDAFLAQQAALRPGQMRNLCHRIPSDLGTEDLISKISGMVFDDGAPVANAGVRSGETSDVATDEDRARQLTIRLEDHARENTVCHWFFFENPPNGLGDAARIQFEHVVEYFAKADSLRIILAGFETYRLAPLRFEEAEEAQTARAPGLLVESLGPFTRTDVQVTLDEIFHSLAPELSPKPAVLTHYVDRIVAGLQTVRPGEFAGMEMARAIRRIRRRAKAELEMD